MTTIYDLKKSLVERQNDLNFSNAQREFIRLLLIGKAGDGGWRPLIDMIKVPPVEHKMNRIRVAIEVALKKTSPWSNTTLWFDLRKLRKILTSNQLPQKKIEQIQQIIEKKPPTQSRHFSFIMKELANHSPMTNEVDHLIEALTKEIQQTSWLALRYLHFLYSTRYQLTILNKQQIKRWLFLQSDKARGRKQDWLNEETTQRFHGTIILPVSQFYDYRMSNDLGMCLGYTYLWAQSLIENKPFFGMRPEQTEFIKLIKYDSILGRRYPELNHLAILTEEVVSLQNLPFKSSTTTISEISNVFFFKSTNRLVEKLLKTMEAYPQDIILLALMGYREGHEIGLCKRNKFYHFFDSNYGWCRFDNAIDFKSWFLFFFKIYGYNDMFHESGIRLMKHSPNVALEKKQNQNILLCFIELFLGPPILLSFIACFYTYDYVIRGIIYGGVGLSKKIQHPFKTPIYPEEQKVPAVLLNHSVDDLALCSKNNKLKQQEPYVCHSLMAGTLFKSCPENLVDKTSSRFVASETYNCF